VSLLFVQLIQFAGGVNVTLEGRRRPAAIVAVLAAIIGAALLWQRADQPVTTAKHVYGAKGHLLRGEYLDVFKVADAGVVCGGYRTKDLNGKFMEPSTFIVWFQTRDWFSWRDPVLLRPTATEPGLFFRTGNALEDQRRWNGELAKLAQERAENDYYKFADACQRALADRRSSGS